MQAVKNTLAENLNVDTSKLVADKDQFSLNDVPDLAGKVAVVTGGTEGIGYGVTQALLSHNISKLIIISQSSDIHNQFEEQVQEDIGAEALQRVVWKQCDLSNLTQTAAVASEIARETEHIHILVNNAGRGIMSYQLSVDGIDLHMATNHFGHVVLTSHLLPVLKRTAAHDTVRIVNQASNAHQNAPSDVKFASLDELNQENIGPNGLYGRSKLAGILYARYLAAHLTTLHPRILINASHPGFVETRQSSQHILEPYPVLGQLVKAAKPIKKDILDGCVSAVYCATATKHSGQYVCPPSIVEEGSEQSRDMALAEQLMKLTREIVEAKTNATSKGCPLQDY